MDEAYCFGEPALEFSPPRPRPLGQRRKKLEVKCYLEGSPCRPRGRPKKFDCEDVANGPPSAASPSPPGPCFTRAKEVWFLENFADLVFPKSDEEVICGLAEDL